MDSIRSIPNFLQHNEPMIGVKTALRGNPLRSDGVDRTGDTSQIRVSATRKTTGRGGQMTVGWNRTQIAPNTVQPTGHKRRAGGRSAVKRIPDRTVLRRDNQWGIPRKRALFVSDGPDSTTSGSDILEGHYNRPPEGEYSDIPNSGQPHNKYMAEELYSPSRQLEKAVVWLQQDIADYREELKLNRTQTPAVSTRPPKRSGFTSTSNWEQYRQVFEAIVRLNGWDNITTALQLLSHLDGDALNVALLVPESQRVLPGFLVK